MSPERTKGNVMSDAERGGAGIADVQIMVYLGILVTRKFFSWQKISRIFTALCQNWTNFP